MGRCAKMPFAIFAAIRCNMFVELHVAEWFTVNIEQNRRLCTHTIFVLSLLSKITKNYFTKIIFV